MTKSKTNDGTNGFASVNGLEIYYEIHGKGQPLVLLHGAFSAIGTSFGELLPELAKTRQVIAFEMQAHGRTADIERPLSLERMADDIAAAIQQLGIEPADVFGYSMGGGVALHVAIRHPDVVHKLVGASTSYKLRKWIGESRTCPLRPCGRSRRRYCSSIGDSDLVQPEHAVEMFRLLGGGVFGDAPAGLPNSQLAILPGTSHVTVVNRADLLLPIIKKFLDAPMPKGT